MKLSSSTMRGISWRQIAAAAAAAAASVASVGVLLLLVTIGFYDQKQVDPSFPRFHTARKLLQVDAGAAAAAAAISTQRMGNRCTSDDIVVHQDATPPLPNGIPTYTVTVLNVCPLNDGCAMSQIHLSCGAFSSARLINPRVFRRLQVGDCLLNDGRPLPPGSSVSFQYANSFSYPLVVYNATCS